MKFLIVQIISGCSPTFPARRQQKQRANHSTRSILLPQRWPLSLPPCPANGLSAPLPAGQSAAGSEFLSTNGEVRPFFLSVRIGSALCQAVLFLVLHLYCCDLYCCGAPIQSLAFYAWVGPPHVASLVIASMPTQTQRTAGAWVVSYVALGRWFGLGQCCVNSSPSPLSNSDGVRGRSLYS